MTRYLGLDAVVFGDIRPDFCEVRCGFSGYAERDFVSAANSTSLGFSHDAPLMSGRVP